MTLTHVYAPEQLDFARRLRAWLAGLVAGMSSADAAEADPTACFSARDWADIPTWHPAGDGEGDPDRADPQSR